MLDEVLRYLRNWFVVYDGIHCGTYTIADGSIELPFLLDGQYYRIVGSVFNDGVYKYGSDIGMQLIDETFTGAVWALAIPQTVLDLVAEISDWQEQYGSTVSGPFTSESFGGYSYTKGSGSSSTSDDSGSGWESAFAGRLSKWRKI